MADVKISALPLASTPLVGTEVLPIVQSATTDQVTVANLTAGRAVSASSLTLTSAPLAVGSGGTGVTTSTGSGAVVLGTTPTFTTSALFPAGTVSAPGISVSGDTNTGLYFPAADTIGFVEGGVEAMRITSAGNVGIGTSPSYRLHVVGVTDIVQYNANATVGSTKSRIGFQDASTTFAPDIGSTGNSVTIETVGAERMRIDASGNVGIGVAAGADIRFRVQGQGTSNSKYTLWTQNSTPSNTFFVRDDGVVAMPLISSGAGTNALKFNTTGGFVTYDTSSARYKDNIRISTYGLDSVNALQSRMFEYKDSGRTDIGLIAEEVFSIIPELVTLDKDGEPDAVSYDRFVSVLVKAIQELAAKVAELEAKI
jgi:hypothetical protein